MDDFELLIVNTHIVCFGLILLAFAFFFLQDIHDIKNNGSLVYRRNLVLLMSAIGAGCFVTLINAWGIDGIFFAIEFSFLVALSVARPKYAVGFLIFLLISRPWETYDNQMMESMPRDISYLVILSMVGHKIINKEFYFRFNLGTLSLIVFGVWMLLSAIFAPHSDVAVTEYINILSKGIILFILVQNSLKFKRDFLPIKAALVVGILEKCFVSFYHSKFMATGMEGIEGAGHRLMSVGILSNSNDIAAIFVLAVPFVMFFILKTNLRPLNWVCAFGTVAIMAILIWQSQSRGAVLSLICSLGAYSLIKITNKKVLTTIGAFCVLGAILLFGKMSRDASDLSESQSNRIVFMKAGVNMAVRNPIFGVGYWGFNDNLGSYIMDGDSATESKMSAHSSWVLALAEGGFIGLFSFLGIWLYGFICAWKMKAAEPEYLMAIIGYGISCTFLSHTYLLYPYILLSIIITHFHILKESSPIKESEMAMAA